MSNLNVNVNNSTPSTFPSYSTDRGKVLYALMSSGGLTGQELKERSGCLGAQSRVNELVLQHHLPIFTTPEHFTRTDGKVVDIVRYHLNWQALNLPDPLVQSFMDKCKGSHVNKTDE